MKKENKYSSVHYNNYLELDKILNSQNLRSVALGEPAHEEMLFIITHQVYELWFKQINHELYSVRDLLAIDDVDEKNLIYLVNRLDRVICIQGLLFDQIKVMETMTPTDFLDFMNYLFPASGFQSFQFRELEALMGLKKESRHTYNNAPYMVVFDENKKEKLENLEESKSLLDLVNDWLERIPFLKMDHFDFVKEYKKAVLAMIEKERKAILETDVLTDEYKQMRIKMLGDTDTFFANVLDENVHNQMRAEGKVKLSYKATLSALFINLYRDQPILQMPFQFLNKLAEIDENLTTWRYRHAQMVLRMLGKKIGTGGSSGHEYLATTAAKHLIFSDLHNLSTLFIPRSELPVLPDALVRDLGFYYDNPM